MLRILIADDHALLRAGLKQVLAAAFAGAEIGEAENAGQVLDQVRRKRWDVLLLDISMPGRSGLDVLRDVKLLDPKLPVLILSAYSEALFGLRVLKAGAAGFAPKDGAPSNLVAAVKQVLAGKKYITPLLAEKLAFSLTSPEEGDSHELLSDREYEVLRLIGRGRTPGQIAQALALSIKTISTYRTRILAKLRLDTTAELTYYAVKNGLVD